MELLNAIKDDEQYAHCQMCGDQYERYMILYEDDAFTLGKRAHIRENLGLDKLCRSCFTERMGAAKRFAFTDYPKS